MAKQVIATTKDRMDKAVQALSRELATIRAGRANASLLDRITVDYYGAPTPVNQLAGISVPEARLLVIQPYDKTVLGEIEKAIQKSDLGLNPTNDGSILRIAIPALTEERRKELAKAAKSEVETGKVNIRNARRNVLDKVKKLKDKGVPEDEVKQVEKEVQDITDKFVAEADKIFDMKQKEIMAV